MQTVNLKVWLIGATLSVVPIFYSAVHSDAVLAQTNAGQGTSMVLELQQLRAEIADLRDQLERQQYQIRQLQRGLQDSSPNQRTTPQATSEQTPVSPANQTVGAIDAAVVPQPNANPNVAATYESNATSPSGLPTAAEASAPAASSPVQVATQPSLPTSEDDFYRPIPAGQSAAVVNENPEVVSAARQARQADNTYPPVIDRSIGAPTTSSAPTVSQGAQNQAAPVVSSNPQANVDLAVPPTVSATATQPQATTLPQVAAPTQVSQLPAAGSGDNIPVSNAPAGGGVIQIPRNSVPAANQPASPAVNSPAVAVTAPQTPILAEDEYYQQGFDLLKQSRYEQAVDVFREQIARYPTGSYADDAHYWVAESMYLNRNLPESKMYFRTIINNFQQSPRLPDAMLKTAYIEQEQGNEIEARILLQEIIQYHPRSDAAISAKNRLEKLD